MLKWQKWPKWLKWHYKSLNVHNFATNGDIEVGFSLFDFYGSKLSVEMVYNGFGSFWVFSYIWPLFQQQLSLASINGVVCHCLRVIWAPSTWSPRLHPITVISLHWKRPRALTWDLLPPPHSPPLKPVQTFTLFTSDQLSRQSRRGIYWKRGFPSTQYKLAQLVPRC